MKKTVLFLVLINLLIITPAYSFDFKNTVSNIQLHSTIRKYNKALTNHNSKNIRNFYDKNYKSKDGFDLNQLIDMLNKTFSAYDNIKYKTVIKDIKISGDKAEVTIQDIAKATIYPTQDKEIKKEKMGRLCGKSTYIADMKKQNNSWKFVSDEVIDEETTLKYGIANDIEMNLIAPKSVVSGEQYDLSLKMDKPDDVIVLASISREEVIYPPVDYQEKFRRFPDSGELERLVKANKKNLDEYAVASVGFTRVNVNEDISKAQIEVLGMAYIMKRIDMIKDKPIKKEVKVNNEG